jgi:hypothetical protein
VRLGSRPWHQALKRRWTEPRIRATLTLYLKDKAVWPTVAEFEADDAAVVHGYDGMWGVRERALARAATPAAGWPTVASRCVRSGGEREPSATYPVHRRRASAGRPQHQQWGRRKLKAFSAPRQRQDATELVQNVPTGSVSQGLGRTSLVTYM